MKLVIIVIVGLIAIALIAFLIIRNQKDEKDLEEKLNNDYFKYTDEQSNDRYNEPNDDDAV